MCFQKIQQNQRLVQILLTLLGDITALESFCLLGPDTIPRFSVCEQSTTQCFLIVFYDTLKWIYPTILKSMASYLLEDEEVRHS